MSNEWMDWTRNKKDHVSVKRHVGRHHFGGREGGGAAVNFLKLFLHTQLVALVIR